MLAATDYVGLGALITATAAAVVSVIVALRQNPIARQMGDVHDAVQTSNGHTIGNILEANDLRDLEPDDAN